MHTLLRNLIPGSVGILLCFLVPFFSKAQVVINEICPANITLITNDDGSFDDWIELYNSGPQDVHLNNWGLTDDPNEKFKFRFPNIELNSGERLMIFASDRNKSVIVDHWEAAVKASHIWRYWPGTSAPDTNWRNPSFNDGSWSDDPGGFGFGDGDDATTISSSARSVMIRKTFFIPDTGDVLRAVLHMDYDDGFVAYLNGVEIARANIGVSGIRPLWNELATSSHEALLFQGQSPDSFAIDIDLFKRTIRNGVNVLAVEAHNYTASSNDLSCAPYLSFGMRDPGSTFSSLPSWFTAPAQDYLNAKFKLSRTGETVYLYDEYGVLKDNVTYTQMESDHSTGRKPDGSGSWCLFKNPTPDASNNGATCYNGYASIPLFSVAPGFYTSSRFLMITTSMPGGVVRYTTNGDVPTATSRQFSSPIQISGSKTIRAAVFASGYLPSPVITNSYFVNENIDLPIFTITTDSLNLWDYNTGIYVMGPNASSVSPYKGANFWQDWRKPASMEYYDKQRNRVFTFDGEIGIYGNYSRAKPQKSFEISLSDRYGTGELNYNFIPDKPWLDKTDNIILRNSGTDWNKVHFRDAFMERVLKNTNAGYIGAEPAVLYLNGAFWGVYTIHENHDHHWMKYNFGYNRDEVDYMKEDGSTITVKEGSDSTWWEMYNYATTQNTSSQSYYDYVSSLLDLNNFADYFIAETYYNNGDWIGDWTNNIKMWRPRVAGGKIRYLTYDLDFGCGLQGSVSENRLSKALNPSSFSHSSELFDAVTDNPTFRRYFINRYADLINTIFQPTNLDMVIKTFEDSMYHDMPAHFQLWGGSMQTWDGYIDDMQDFCDDRPAIVRDQIENEFNLSRQVTLTLNVSPAGAGRIQISTIIPSSYPWNGVYFYGNPVTVTAIPNPGYTFSRFSSSTLGSNNTNQSATGNFSTSQTITAYFTGSPVTPQIVINEINYNSPNISDAGDWVEIWNRSSVAVDLSDWELRDEEEHHRYIIPVGTVIGPNSYLVFSEDMTKFSAKHPGVSNVIGPIGFNFGNNGDQVRLLNHADAVVSSVYYQDSSPWPVLADGDGYTCEYSNPVNDPNDGNSWFSGCLGGSPGRAFSNVLGVPVNITGSTTFCNGGSVQLQATSDPNYTYQWNRNSTLIPGATSSTLTATQAGIYTVTITYQGCSSTSAPTTLSLVTQGPDPVVTDGARCGTGAVELYATSSDTVYWYDAPNGNLIAVGDTLLTPVISTTTTYYAQTSLSCPSNRVPVVAEILSPSAPPLVSDDSRCGPGAITLTAIDTATVRWYTAANGGALLNVGNTFAVPFISSDTTFYVESGSICPSMRVPVSVQIYQSAAPSVNAASRCGTGAVVLIASSPDPLYWFDSPTGGTPLDSGSMFITPVLSATDTFYVESNGGCASTRIPALASVNQIPAAPMISDTAICGASSVVLQAISSEQVYWYDAPAGGNLIFTGPNFTTPFISSPVTYYLEAGYICRSHRRMVNVSVNPAATVDLGPDTAIVSGASIWLTAAPGFNTYQWSTGSVAQSISVNAAGTYWVNVTDGNNCRASDTVEVSVIAGVGTIANELTGLKLYPNPVEGISTFEIGANRSMNARLVLTDVSGRVVWEQQEKLQSGLNRITLDFSGVASGAYLLKTEAKDGSTVIEVMIR